MAWLRGVCALHVPGNALGGLTGAHLHHGGCTVDRVAHHWLPYRVFILDGVTLSCQVVWQACIWIIAYSPRSEVPNTSAPDCLHFLPGHATYTGVVRYLSQSTKSNGCISEYACIGMMINEDSVAYAHLHHTYAALLALFPCWGVVLLHTAYAASVMLMRSTHKHR